MSDVRNLNVAIGLHVTNVFLFHLEPIMSVRPYVTTYMSNGQVAVSNILD